MLLLTRRPDEKIIIADEIEMTILGIKGKQVKIGINAPRDILIMRGDLITKALEEQKKYTSSLAFINLEK